jgi:surfeit locus 1 family protein
VVSVSGGRRRAIVAIAALLGVVVTARLGTWQLERAAQKQAMQRSLDERSRLPPLDAAELARDVPGASLQHDRRVRLSGRWLDANTVFLENRPMEGRTGFIVVTPLLLDRDAGVVLVQRGWVARDPNDRARLPELATPAGAVEVHGWVAGSPSRWLEFAGAGSGPIRQNLDVVDFARETGLALRPLSVRQAESASTAGDGLLRAWLRPAIDVHKHYGYAVQWFSLAALIAGLYVWFQLVRPWIRGAR